MKDKEKGIKAKHYRKSSIHKKDSNRQRNEATTKRPETVNKPAVVIILQYPCPSIITLNGNELNSPIFWPGVAG